MSATMAKKKSNEDRNRLALRSQIVFRLLPEAAEALRDWEELQKIKPNISALMNTALLEWLEKQKKDQ